jgi:hypothetical protein
MSSDNIFNCNTWFTAEGRRADLPVMYRGRDISSTLIPCRQLSYLLIISLKYNTEDESGLPSRSQYDNIEDFEQSFIDRLEADQRGLVAFVETYNGVIQYFVYVSNADVSTSVSNMTLDGPLNLDVRTVQDSGWQEYQRFLAGMRRAD